MTPPLRHELQYAPELAVVLALCATAQATRAALAAIHGTGEPGAHISREQQLATQLCLAIANLARRAAAYRDYVADLAAPGPAVHDDLPF